MNNERVFNVTDKDGNQRQMYILFTTSLESYEKNYVFYYELEDQEHQVFVSSYDDSGELKPVTDEDEWKLLEQVFNQFIEEQQNCSCNNSCDSCNGCCDSCSEDDCQNN